jgi:hypothetical protein
MKTILHRSDRNGDGDLRWWSIKTMLYYCAVFGRQGSITVHWCKERPQTLELEADRLFGPELLMSHVDMMRLGLRVEFRPSD